MVRGFVIHAVTYAVVNALLVGVYYATSGSTLTLHQIENDPISAVRHGFWPLWVMGLWGAGLVIHLAIVVTAILFGSTARKRRRAMARNLAHAGARPHSRPGRPSAPGTPPPIPDAPATPGFDPHLIARDATKAAFGLVDALGQRIAQSRPSAAAPTTTAAPTAPVGRHWVAAMFTDIAGSTDLTETLGDEQWSRVLGEHRSAVRDCLAAHGGKEVGTQGDGFLVRFDHAIDAVACAVAIERRLDDNRRRGSFSPEVRIGIHAGEATTAEDADLVGKVVNVASRVTKAAQPGEILVTESVADRLGPSVQLVDRGLQDLKGIGQPRHLLAVVWQNDAATTRPADPAQAAE